MLSLTSDTCDPRVGGRFLRARRKTSHIGKLFSGKVRNVENTAGFLREQWPEREETGSLGCTEQA